MNKEESVNKALTKIKAWVTIDPNLEDSIKEILEIVWEESEYKQKYYSTLNEGDFKALLNTVGDDEIDLDECETKDDSYGKRTNNRVP